MEPKIISEDGRFYIEFADRRLEISENDAGWLKNHPDKIYDAIVSLTRKFNFNTAEDSGELNF